MSDLTVVRGRLTRACCSELGLKKKKKLRRSFLQKKKKDVQDPEGLSKD